MTDVDHDLASEHLDAHLAAVRHPKPEPRYGHEVAPMPDGNLYLTEWRHATDLPMQLARHHTAVAYGWVLTTEAGMLPFADVDMDRAINHLIPAYQLAWTWASLAKLPDILAAKPSNLTTWILDLARDMATDLTAPQVFGPNLRQLLGVLGLDPASIKAYGGAA